MVNALNICYEPSETLVAQGKNVAKYEKKGFYAAKGGNGTYRMVKPSKVTLFFEANEKSHSCSVKQLIRDAYNISNVSHGHASRFLNDLQAGNIKLNYSEEKGLSLAN